MAYENHIQKFWKLNYSHSAYMNEYDYPFFISDKVQTGFTAKANVTLLDATLCPHEKVPVQIKKIEDETYQVTYSSGEWIYINSKYFSVKQTLIILLLPVIYPIEIEDVFYNVYCCYAYDTKFERSILFTVKEEPHVYPTLKVKVIIDEYGIEFNDERIEEDYVYDPQGMEVEDEVLVVSRPVKARKDNYVGEHKDGSVDHVNGQANNALNLLINQSDACRKDKFEVKQEAKQVKMMEVCRQGKSVQTMLELQDILYKDKFKGSVTTRGPSKGYVEYYSHYCVDSWHHPKYKGITAQFLIDTSEGEVYCLMCRKEVYYIGYQWYCPFCKISGGKHAKFTKT